MSDSVYPAGSAQRRIDVFRAVGNVYYISYATDLRMLPLVLIDEEVF
jgi:hypothetical protein